MPTDRFWGWWATNSEQLTEALDAGDPQVATALQPLVAELHPDLAWQIAPGHDARYRLVISAAGRRDLRPVTERWRRSGPPDDEIWEFRPAQPPRHEMFAAQLDVSGQILDVGQACAQARVDDRACALDVGVFHPGFAALGTEIAEQLAQVFLVWALGEDDTERWIGQVTVLEQPPIDRVPVAMLSSLSSQLIQRWAHRRWAVLEGQHGNRRLLASILHPLHRVDYPLFDEHVGVRLPYTDQTPDGLPGERALGDLRTFEETLVARIGGQGVLVAHQTSLGERLLHVYDDSTASVAPVIEAMLGMWDGGEAMVEVHPDPAWRAVEPLRP